MRKYLLSALLLLVASGCAQQKDLKAQKQEDWSNTRASVLVSVANEQYNTGNLESARKSLADAAKQAPNYPPMHMLSAKISIKEGKLEEANISLTRARAVDVKNPEIEYLSGVIHQRWQKPEQALEFYSKAIEKSPNELAYYMAKSEMLMVLDRRTEALAVLQAKLSYFENNAHIRDAVGQLLVQDGKYADAAYVLRQASALVPDDLTIREHLALAVYYAKQYREATPMLEKLVGNEKYAERADLWTALAECQLQNDRAQDARDNFEKVTTLQPAVASGWLNLGKVALQLNDLKRAELSLKKAQTLEPKDPEASLMLGYLRLRQNRLNEAFNAFKAASALDAKDPVSLCMSGYVLEKMGRPADAIKYYSQALKVKPNDELATTLMAQVQVND